MYFASGTLIRSLQVPGSSKWSYTKQLIMLKHVQSRGRLITLYCYIRKGSSLARKYITSYTSYPLRMNSLSLSLSLSCLSQQYQQSLLFLRKESDKPEQALVSYMGHLTLLMRKGTHSRSDNPHFSVFYFY